MLKRAALYTLLFASSFALLRAEAEVRAEFHQTYSLDAGGRVALSNVNGAVHVSAWDRNEVKVDAVKRGNTQQDLDDARIVVDASAGSVDIRTKYPENNHNHHAAAVEYTVTVPRNASLDHIESVNGEVTIDGVNGAIRAKSVNGRVDIRHANGDLEASTVNGRVDAAFDRLAANHISLNTVNGAISVGLPKDAGARLKASTVHGAISSDFDLTVRKIAFTPGSTLDTTIGNGRADIRLATVNGGIQLSGR